MVRKKSAKSVSSKRAQQLSRAARKQAAPGRSIRAVRPATSALSKKDRVVALLRHPNGATIAAIVQATGWTKHTVRGFFSAVVRRRLGLELKVENKGDIRVYRIVEP